MSRQTFSPRAVAGLVRAGDSRQFAINLLEDREAIIESVSTSVLDGSVDLAKFQRTTIKRKPCISYRDYSTHILFRGLARYYARRLNITLPSRDKIVRGVIETLMDGTPMYAMRRDITSFYESIPLAPIKSMLQYEIPASTLVRNYIQAFFTTHCSGKSHGLPRGIGLTAILAEFSMRDFDSKIKSIPGVYKYFRYSDDILIFATQPSNELDGLINRELPPGMQFNAAKCSETFFSSKASRSSGTQQSMEYLGYCFTATQQKGRENSRTVRVSLSRRKLNKLKTRIILSLLSFSRKPNWTLLRDRCQFVMGNYRVRRHGTDVIKGATHVFSGLYYNYKLCGNYYVRANTFYKEPYDCAELKAMDAFYHSILRTQIAQSKIILNSAQLEELKSFSFFKGYSLRIKVRQPHDRVAFIKRAWRNA